MLNTEVIVHPRLHHIGLLTGNLARLVDWYHVVLGMRAVYAGENPTGAPPGTPPAHLKAAFLTNDEMSHRIAAVEVPGLTRDPERSRHQRLQHVAFEVSSLDELLGSFARLKKLEILPRFSVDEGAQIGLYYDDPDGNSIEINCSNYPDRWAAIEHMQTSPDFARRALGTEIDPSKMIVAREAGATAWDLHMRASQGEFAPEVAFNPASML